MPQHILPPFLQAILLATVTVLSYPPPPGSMNVLTTISRITSRTTILSLPARFGYDSILECNAVMKTITCHAAHHAAFLADITEQKQAGTIHT